MISFQTAYLKALHPTEFIAAIMSLDIANVEKLAQFFQEAKRMDMTIAPPCVNRSMADFDVDNGAVLYALGALKNVGVEAMRHVVEVREEGGPFKDLFDFARRVDTRIVNKRAFENLARGGAFDCLEPNRAKSLASASILQQIGSRSAQEKESAQNSLFGDAPETMAEPALPNPAPWSNVEQLDHELGAIGFYLGGHPLETYLPILERKKAIMAVDIDDRYKAGARNVRLAGVVRKRQERISKRGKRFAWVNISDPTGDFEVFFGEELLAVHRNILEAGALIELTAEAKDREGEISLFANTVTSLELTGEASLIKGLQIRLRSATIETLDELEKTLDTLKSAPAKTTGYVEIFAPLGGQREGHWRLPGKWGIDSSIQKAIKAHRAVEMITEIAA